MSDELISNITRELNKAQSIAAKRRMQAKSLKNERDVLAKQVDEISASLDQITKEFAEYQSKTTASPSELASEVDRLKGELRTREHRSVFDQITREKNLRPGAESDLWTLLNYRAETDVPDRDFIASLVDQAVSERPYYLAESHSDEPSRETLPPQGFPSGGSNWERSGTPRSAPGAARGSAPAPSIGPTIQIQNNAEWLYNNQKAIAESYAQGKTAKLAGSF